jgi:nucleoside-diphosphate-sugar epimerase
MHMEGDNSRLKAATGWAPTIDVLDGLADVVADMRVAA